MAEAEDVITDAARHATIFVRDIWRRHHPLRDDQQPIELASVTQRLSILIQAVLGVALPLRVAQPPAPSNLLQRLVARRSGPFHVQALPATDGRSIWLPRDLGTTDATAAHERYRILALQQAMRALRMAQDSIPPATLKASPLAADVYLLLQAAIADHLLVKLLPGTRSSLNALRCEALAERPPLEAFPLPRQQLEQQLHTILEVDCAVAPSGINLDASAADLYRQACEMANGWNLPGRQLPRGGFLLKDLWTGELRWPDGELSTLAAAEEAADSSRHATRSARLTRAPKVREAEEDEEDERQGAWMIQSAQPQEHAEDPIGMQRPTDRDESTAAEEFADSLSELSEARLISTPGRAREVLLSDDAPDARSKKTAPAPTQHADAIAYPEWNYRTSQYRERGATVRVQAPQLGPQAWVTSTMAKHAAMLNAIRRRFEMLRASRVRLHKQMDGDEIDLDAFIDGHADFRAGLPMPQALYQITRPARRDMSICLLIDISGSTDSWVSSNRRIIDVEREALLLVCVALEGMGEPYAVQAFSGDGPHNVTIRPIKDFDEIYSDEVALRIAALEPERYTRTGTALRHATALLMKQNARHRLLLLLSDGKPNDSDDYEGRYGVEDMRQAVTEADWQGVSPFCLTIDRHAADYLPRVFGQRRYALLPKPDLLPTVLLDWMKRLLVP